ncbi:MAG: DUF4113 domain-containing protein [Burkholderiales bacterium]|nr:DUF4113 domain-containing protein [Burkholderiales bacterium]
MCSRHFGRYIQGRQELHEALAAYLSCASDVLPNAARHRWRCDRLYPHQSVPRCAAIQPHPDRSDAQPEQRYAGGGFQHSAALLDQLYHPGFDYQKAGMMLSELKPENRGQRGQFDPDQEHGREKSKVLIETMDSINARWGRGTVRVSSMAPCPKWGMRRQRLSRSTQTRERSCRWC